MKATICFGILFVISSSIGSGWAQAPAAGPNPQAPVVPPAPEPAKTVPAEVDPKNDTVVTSTVAPTNSSTPTAVPPTIAPNSTVVPTTNGTTTAVPPATNATTTAVPTTNATAPTPTPTPTPSPAQPTTNATTAKPCPTLAPANTTTNLPATAAPAERSFDGLSFIGGMVLTVGLLAIGVVGFKYYRSRGDQHSSAYNTLH